MSCKECQEQARLLGMSAERELALRAEIDRLHRSREDTLPLADRTELYRLREENEVLHARVWYWQGKAEANEKWEAQYLPFFDWTKGFLTSYPPFECWLQTVEGKYDGYALVQDSKGTNMILLRWGEVLAGIISVPVHIGPLEVIIEAVGRHMRAA